MNDQILPPSVDPDTRKVAIRTVHAINEAGTRRVTQVRDYAPIIADVRQAMAVNSEPLSERIWSGGPCLTNSSVRQ